MFSYDDGVDVVVVVVDDVEVLVLAAVFGGDAFRIRAPEVVLVDVRNGGAGGKATSARRAIMVNWLVLHSIVVDVVDVLEKIL